MRWWRNMITKTTTTIKEALAEDRQRVQGIRYNDGGSSGSKTGLVNWQRQRSVYFPWYCVANKNTVSSMSCRCLVLIFFSSYFFFPSSLQEILSVMQSCGKYVFNLAYVPPTYRRVKKLQGLMINKDVHKSLAPKKGNEIIIWNWNNFSMRLSWLGKTIHILLLLLPVPYFLLRVIHTTPLWRKPWLI